MKVAIIHEWLETYAGSERVLEQMIKCFPDADVFAVVDFIKPDERSFLQGRPVQTRQRCPDITLARRELDWEPSILLEDGLRQTIDYFVPRAAVVDWRTNRIG
jgi:nucleoside-diphosphate-sugar epimerase